EFLSTLATMHRLAVEYRVDGKLDMAVSLLEKNLALRTKVLGPEHSATLATISSLAAAHGARREHAKAEALWIQLVDARARQNGTDDTGVAGALQSLAASLSNQKKFAEAETRLRASLRIREAKEPDVWTTFNTKSLLGAALVAQQKYSDAEPLLL